MGKIKTLACTLIGDKPMKDIAALCKDMDVEQLIQYRLRVLDVIKKVYLTECEILQKELKEQEHVHSNFVNISKRIMRMVELPKEAIEQHQELIKTGEQFILDIKNSLCEVETVYQNNYNNIDELFQEQMLRKAPSYEYKPQSK